MMPNGVDFSFLLADFFSAAVVRTSGELTQSHTSGKQQADVAARRCYAGNQAAKLHC